MDEEADHRTALKQHTYKELQTLASALNLPSNIKKSYLIQLIHAKKNHLEAEVDSIIQKAKLEREQISKSSKKRNRKAGKIQGNEVSSTNIPLSPPIDTTPKRQTNIQNPRTRNSLIDKQPRRLSASAVANKTDRVLRSRSSNTKRDAPNYAILNDPAIYVSSTESLNCQSQNEIVGNSNDTPEHSSNQERIDESNDGTVNMFRNKIAVQYKPNLLRNRKQIERSSNQERIEESNAETVNMFKNKIAVQYKPNLVRNRKQMEHSSNQERIDESNDGTVNMFKNKIAEQYKPNLLRNRKQMAPRVRNLNPTALTPVKREGSILYLKSQANAVDPKFRLAKSVAFKPINRKYSKINNSILKSTKNIPFETVTTQNSRSNAEVPIQGTQDNKIDAHTKDRQTTEFGTNRKNSSTMTGTNIKQYPKSSKLTQRTPNTTPRGRSLLDYSNEELLEYVRRSQMTLNRKQSRNTDSNKNHFPKVSRIESNMNGSRTVESTANYFPIMSRRSDSNVYNPNSTMPQSNMKFTRPVIVQRNYDYPNMSSWTEVPHMVTPPGDDGDYTVYHQKDEHVDPLIVQPTVVASTTACESVLPKFDDTFRKLQYRDFTEPLFVDVGAEGEGYTKRAATNGRPMLEKVYNIKNEYISPLRSNQHRNFAASSSNETHCVSVLPSATCTTVVQSSPLSSFQGRMLCYEDSGDHASQVNDFLILEPEHEQDMKLQNYYGAFSADTSLNIQKFVVDATTEELMQDALEFISEDLDYLNRLSLDGKMQCIFCSWAGPQFVLETHMKLTHADVINWHCKSEWNITYRLGSLVNQELWLSQVTEYDSHLYMLSVKYEDPDRFLASLTTVTPQLGKKGSVTVYNKVTGEPYTWEGEIQQLSSKMPYDNDKIGLEINELSKLELLPNSANLKLLNRELVLTSPTKAVVGRPELNNIHIILFVKVSD